MKPVTFKYIGDHKTIYDLGVIDALSKYVLMGLDPGSFADYLLMNDYDGARSVAHEKLKACQEQDLVQNHIDFVQNYMPIQCHGSRETIWKWMHHQGLEGSSAETRALIKISSEFYWFLFFNRYALDFDWITGKITFIQRSQKSDIEGGYV